MDFSSFWSTTGYRVGATTVSPLHQRYNPQYPVLTPQSVSSLLTPYSTVTSSLAMIELFYSKIHIHSACGRIHGLCALIPVSVAFYVWTDPKWIQAPAINYFLDGQPLSFVDSLSWRYNILWHALAKPHFQYFCKTSRILNFVGHNVYGCSAEAKATAYTTLVRPLLEFSSAAWDPHLAKDVHQLERVQRLAL